MEIADLAVSSLSLIVGAVALILAYRSLRIGNKLAGISVTQGQVALHHRVLAQMIAHPELYPYFYDSKPLPQQGRTRIQALLVAEMVADVLSTGLDTRERISSSYLGPWTDYSKDMVARSPALQLVISQNPAWWDRLAPLLDQPAGRILQADPVAGTQNGTEAA
ncbi:hypothetical protein [Nonomuraea sp. NPDC050310]|uniref:hypothetical protein n=1 Tax=unclassified Nonomuraea TaxID=2593643 RepID=UPI0033CCA1B7